MKKHLGEDFRKLGINFISAVAIGFTLGGKEITIEIVALGVIGYITYIIGIFFSQRDDRTKSEKEKAEKKSKTSLISTLIPVDYGIIIYTTISKSEGEDDL
ncbi:hypothetical protein ACUT8K_002936 [Vibrio parahaemolyticus]|uniref:Uncharacterized protein n=1 Tax=Vibrio alginolyticus TaxID=663 RepID=A0A7Y4F136_VIBAL|nr:MULTISPECIES: hypothetical protein [Vibrio harveyi group]HAS6252993.1 hypothetical protein [Vibrio vulnificus]AHJ02723.1 hypothetical protein VPUCM_p0046 [Vibrio parahaemolyticus UCM-V493]APX10218.1 hypothetical protein BWP24_28920 [Vibrio campbellii]EGQ8101377.1 hypothetical protein [Vibrio parahaemolyticus]EGQ8229641.1 hypothetical protein [Vibrio parahaemolyticus]